MSLNAAEWLLPYTTGLVESMQAVMGQAVRTHVWAQCLLKHLAREKLGLCCGVLVQIKSIYLPLYPVGPELIKLGKNFIRLMKVQGPTNVSFLERHAEC